MWQPAGMSLVSPPDEATGPDVCRSPVFVLTASRSGSTLLRFILDSHPDLACPPETGITAACVQLARTWDILENAGASAFTPVTQRTSPSADTLAAVRDAVDRAYGRYLRDRGKRRWCDKSLDTHLHAELMSMLYPEAKFICLYRHVMDVVASGVETCPWGLSRFGFDAYVTQFPGNSVAAIASYWLDTAEKTMSFADEHPDSCYRVRYEDLATAPEETIAGVLSFLGAEQVPGITRACFAAAHEGNGPGDEKIWFTSEVSDGSIGRGVRVPTGGLPPPLRQRLNDTLAKLEYRLVDDEWNAAVGRVDPRADAGPGGHPARDHAARGERARQEVAAAVGVIGERIGSRPQDKLGEIAVTWPALAGQTVALVVQGAAGEHEELRWSFPASPGGQPALTANGDGGGGNGADSDRKNAGNSGGLPVATVIAGADTWQSLLDGEAHVIAEMTAGRLRCVNRRDTHRIRSEEIHAVAALLGLNQIPVGRN
jgi:hypothetical protein